MIQICYRFQTEANFQIKMCQGGRMSAKGYYTRWAKRISSHYWISAYY